MISDDDDDNAEETRAAVQQTPPDKTPERWVLKMFFKKWRWRSMYNWRLYDGDITERFASAIKNKEDVEAREIFKNNKEKINPFYQDADGNTLLHLSINFPYGGNKPFNEIARGIRAPNYIKNLDKKYPCEMSNGYDVDIVGGKNKNEFLQRRVENRNNFVIDMAGYHRKDFFGAIFPGKRVTDNLDLYFECEEGHCEVPDAWAELNALDFRIDLSLHQRLAIANRLSSARASDVETMQEPCDTPNCYVTAAITMVVTKKSIKDKTPPFQLQAITVPINVPDYMVYTNGEEYAHAEKILFTYLNDEVVLKKLTRKIKAKANITVEDKCYGVVFDMHSTYNMCNDCEKNLYGLLRNRGQNSFMLKLEEAIEESGFELPPEKSHIDLLTPTSSRIFFTPRISCQELSFYENHLGVNKGTRDSRGHPYLPFEHVSDNERNIANHRNAVIFHTQYDDRERKYSFSSNDRGVYPPCYVPNQTAFVMRPDKDAKWHRRKLASPVLFSDVVQEPLSGLFVNKYSSRRMGELDKMVLFLWKQTEREDGFLFNVPGATHSRSIENSYRF